MMQTVGVIVIQQTKTQIYVRPNVNSIQAIHNADRDSFPYFVLRHFYAISIKTKKY